MIKDAYVQYQSRKAAKDLFDAMELLPGRVKMERCLLYTSSTGLQSSL